MGAHFPPATLITSVDADLSQFASAREAELAARDVLGCLHESNCVATWGLTDVGCELGDLVTTDASHEVALLGHAALVGSEHPRAHFSRSMAAQLKRGRAAGRIPSSILLADGCRVGHVDLLVKLGITAVRSNPVVQFTGSRWSPFLLGRSLTLPQPHWLRWGVREFPAAVSLHHHGTRFLRRMVDQSLAEGRIIQWALDLRQCAAAPRATLAALRVVLRHVAQRMSEGALQTATLDQTVLRFTQRQQRSQRPSRSILQRQAA